MRLLFTFILCIQTLVSLGQDSIPSERKDLEIIKSFIADLSNEKLRTDVILSQHIIVENPDNELYDYLEVCLDEIRINLLSKKIADIQYTPYRQMPHREIMDIDTENLDTTRIYFLHYKRRQFLAVYLENEKIASFTLVSKGNNKAHFVLY